MPGGRLTQRDRNRIAAGLSEGLSYAEIARRLGRPTSTISREVHRNGGPGGYRPEQAHRATERRARRSTPAVLPAGGGPYGPAGDTEAEAVAVAVRMGLQRMTARVLIRLLITEDGRLTAAELARGLKVSPASVSTAVGYLIEQGLIRRERDPRRRRDVYVMDDDMWYHTVVRSAHQTLEAAEMTRRAAEDIGPDTPVGRRLTTGAHFLERISLDTLASAERWRDLLP
ncbi:MarR family transcriptional regulator [Bailinhaonella thermotolerans]|uniref:MarR family transcriptional regulator n=1 Tax=Bailinhaonella thermotolerans TaxID=1070861 RepID=A0A3A4ARV5_9ACTN|nr:helix-turn-helix domain-containing protein [Bailinhaonella thermotolerans]RJL30014.1 MarR family transcriptional regulator [Bailinhaonella thermotolerans]